MAAITSSTEHRPVIDPSTYLAKETLKDGTEVTVRAIRREDSGSILESFKTLDREAIYRRFFSPKKELSDAELKQLTDVDFSRVVALVVTTGTSEGETLIGGARYAAEGPETSRTAELAFVTGEDYRAMLIRSAVVAGVILPPEVLRSLDGSSSPASLFDGLDKLGLKLVGTKAPLELLVIDKMLKSPTEN